VTLYKALTLSLNTVAVNLMRDVGPAETISLARRLGITAKLEPNLSLALGSSGIPMIQMATAYAALGRTGSAVEPYAIRRIKDKDGQVLYEYKKPKKERQIVSRQNIAQINHMMRSVIENGTGRGARLPYPAAGKTGTSQDFRDAWFAGFTNRYATVIWMGNDDNSTTKRLTGGSAPARVWKEVMMRAQSQGGKAYATFSGYAPSDAFQNLLADILSDDYQIGPDEKEGGLFNWLSPSSQGAIQQTPPGDKTHYKKGKKNQWKINE
jgi:penicillin-binding protein 1A